MIANFLRTILRTIRISDEVWDAIAERGNFGETPDDVLRRIFRLTPRNSRRRRARRRMTTRVENGRLCVAFDGGPEKTWPLPFRDNKPELRLLRDEALSFAEEHGATDGQLKGLIRVMTGAGYHLTK